MTTFEILAASPTLAPILKQLERTLGRLGVGRRVPPILLQGETGTGKGLLAHCIHGASPRSGGPLVAVNCSAIPESLLEAELFGFERGAFTDARQPKAGLMQTADGGTLFLDEVALLPVGLQAKVLTAIDERRVRRLGSVHDEAVDVLIIAATNTDLVAAVRGGRFREDLYHRLAVLTFTIPPLRDRGAEILELARTLLARACLELGLKPKILTEDACASLLAYPWPGNVREMGNLMERMALLIEGVRITAADLDLHRPAPAAASSAPAAASGSLRVQLEAFERARVEEALSAAGGRVSVAAARLGIPRSTLRYHLKRLSADRAERLSSNRPQRPGSAVVAGRLGGEAALVPFGETGPIRWERRQIAFLRAVLVPFEDSPMSPIVGGSDIATLADKVTSLGGRIEEIAAAGIVAAFGALPLDEAPSRAAHAAWAMCRALANVPKPPLRVALHVESVLVVHVASATHIEQDARCHVLATLDTLLERAAFGTVVVSEATAPLLARRYHLRPLEPSVPKASAVYQLLGPGPPPADALTPFVGRERELLALQALRAGLMIDGARFAMVVGDAGIGKSRLLREFRETLRDADVTWLEVACTPAGAVVPYFAAAAVLRAALGLADDERGGISQTMLERRLAIHGLDVAENDVLAIGRALGTLETSTNEAALAPALRARLTEAMRRVLLHSARRRPVVLAVEDVHWIDHTSHTCLRAVAKSLSGAPILFLATARPEARATWTGLPKAVELQVEPLGHRASLEVMRAVLGRETVPEPLAQMILTKAEGNPLFLEELARDARDSAGRGAAPSLPPTIQALLERRVDVLAPTSRQLLETASVLGNEFPRAMLQVLWEPTTPFPEGALGELVGLGLLSEQRMADTPGYAFRHVLVQEAVYERVDHRRRQILHRRAGEVLEAQHADRRVVLDRLAHHFARSGDTRKAIEYLVPQAIAAGRAHAPDEALTALNEALSQIERLPAGAEQDELFGALVSRQRDVLFNLTKLNRGRLDFLLRQRERVEALGDRSLHALYFLWLSRISGPLGEFTIAIDAGQRAIVEAESIGDEVVAAAARGVLSYRYAWTGRLLEGRACAQQSARALEGTPHRYWLGHAYRGVAFNSLQQGHFTDAVAAAGRMGVIGREIEDAILEFSADWMQAAVLILSGDEERAVKRCHEVLERAPGPVEIAQASALLGAAYVEGGRADAAIEVLEPLISHSDRLRQAHVQGMYAAFLAEAYRLRHELDRAESLAGAGLAATLQAGYRWGTGIAQRELGRIADSRGDAHEAAARFAEAIETFESMPARCETARTRLLLGELRLRRQDPLGAELLDEAAREFDALGVIRYAARARAALGR